MVGTRRDVGLQHQTNAALRAHGFLSGRQCRAVANGDGQYDAGE
jgi:hypothetical protein